MRAILYSGDLRTYEHCAQNHADVLGECDVYFSLFDEFNYVDRINDPWHSLAPNRYSGKVTERLVRSMTPECFNIRGIKIEPYFPLRYMLKLKQNNALFYQYYKMWEAFNMLAYKYDEIIRMRCDITIERVKFRKGLTCNKYVWYSQSKQDIIRRKLTNLQATNEMVFTGNYDTMQKACRVVNNLENLNDMLDKKDQYGESVFANHLRIEGLVPRLFDFKYRVIR